MGRYYFWLRLKAALCLCGESLLRLVTTETRRTQRTHRDWFKLGRLPKLVLFCFLPRWLLKGSPDETTSFGFVRCGMYRYFADGVNGSAGFAGDRFVLLRVVQWIVLSFWPKRRQFNHRTQPQEESSR
jgi:hypothetical protein